MCKNLAIASCLAAGGPIVNVLIYDPILAEKFTYHLPNVKQMCYMSLVSCCTSGIAMMHYLPNMLDQIRGFYVTRLT